MCTQKRYFLTYRLSRLFSPFTRVSRSSLCLSRFYLKFRTPYKYITCKYIYIYKYIHTYTYIYIYLYLYISNVYIYNFIYIYITCIHIYIHIYDIYSQQTSLQLICLFYPTQQWEDRALETLPTSYTHTHDIDERKKRKVKVNEK